MAGRRVLVVERDMSTPDRIVGELLQPGGCASLRALGMGDCLEGIDAAAVEGYYVCVSRSSFSLVACSRCELGPFLPSSPIASLAGKLTILFVYAFGVSSLVLGSVQRAPSSTSLPSFERRQGIRSRRDRLGIDGGIQFRSWKVHRCLEEQG